MGISILSAGQTWANTRSSINSNFTELLINSKNLSQYNNNLATAVASIGESNETIIISIKPSDLTANLIIPKNITLLWCSDAIIDGAFALTINGGLQAGLYQIFGSSVTVSGTPITPCGYINWFGADTSLDDNSVAINKTITSFKKKLPIKIVGVYTLTSPIVPYSGTVLLGDTDRYGNISKLNFVGSSAISISNTNVNSDGRISGAIIKGISFFGDYSNIFISSSVSVGSGDLAWGEFSGNAVNGFTTVTMLLTGNTVEKNIFEDCSYFEFKGSDSIIKDNFFNTRERVTDITMGCVYLSAIASSIFQGNYITSGLLAHVALNPIGLRVVNCPEGELRILDNWIDLSAEASISIVGSNNISILNNRPNGLWAVTTKPYEIYIENASNILISNNLFKDLGAGEQSVFTVGNVSNITITDNIYKNCANKEITVASITSTNVTIKENYPEFKQYDYAVNTHITSKCKNTDITNTGATGLVYYYMDGYASFGDRYRFRRVANQQMVVHDNIGAATIISLDTGGVQYAEVTYNSPGVWGVVVLTTE